MCGWLTQDDSESDSDLLADPESVFDSKIFGQAWDDPTTNGDKAVEEIRISTDGVPVSERFPITLLEEMTAVVAFAVQAIKAEVSDKHDEAWTYAADARYWAGVLLATWVHVKDVKNPAVELAKMRHAENHALIGDALKYWRENIDPSLSASKAANELVRVVPLSHKKLAEVVAAEKKKRL